MWLGESYNISSRLDIKDAYESFIQVLNDFTSIQVTLQIFYYDSTNFNSKLTPHFVRYPMKFELENLAQECKKQVAFSEPASKINDYLREHWAKEAETAYEEIESLFKPFLNVNDAEFKIDKIKIFVSFE